MKWIKCPEGMHNGRACLPLDKQFFAIWKGCICIAEYDSDDDCFYICTLPAQYGVMKVDRERECKFTHYCEIVYPEDY